MMYRIAWRSRTGTTGRGDGIFTRERAEEIAADMNKENRDIGMIHWAEAAHE